MSKAKEKKGNSKPQWQIKQADAPEHEQEFLQEQMQRLVRKALVTIETTLNDHNLPPAERLDASLKIVSLFKQEQQEVLPINAEIVEKLASVEQQEDTQPESDTVTTLQTAPFLTELDTISRKTDLSEAEETELEELRAVL